MKLSEIKEYEKMFERDWAIETNKEARQHIEKIIAELVWLRNCLGLDQQREPLPEVIPPSEVEGK